MIWTRPVGYPPPNLYHRAELEGDSFVTRCAGRFDRRDGYEQVTQGMPADDERCGRCEVLS